MKITKSQLVKAMDFAQGDENLIPMIGEAQLNSTAGLADPNVNIYSNDISNAMYRDPLIANVMGAYNKSTAAPVATQSAKVTAPTITYINRRGGKPSYLPVEKPGLSKKAKIALGVAGGAAALTGLGIATNTFGMGDKARDILGAINGSTNKKIANLENTNRALAEESIADDYKLNTASGGRGFMALNGHVNKASDDEANLFAKIVSSGAVNDLQHEPNLVATLKNLAANSGVDSNNINYKNLADQIIKYGSK